MLLWAASHQLDAIRFISLCSKFVQFSSVLQSCRSLCNAMDCSMPGFPIHHQLLELTQVHVHRLGDAIQPSHPVFPFSSCLQSFLILGSFPMSQFFPSGVQIVGVSASASVFPVTIQGWFFFRMDWFDLLTIQGTLKSLLQHQSSKGICVCHLSVMSYSPCLDLTTRTEFKQHAKMRIKSQGPIYTHRVTGEAPIVFKGQSWIDLMQE